MIQPLRRRWSRWRHQRLGVALLAGCLLLMGLASLSHVRPANAEKDCRQPTNGDLFQARDDALYLYTEGVLRAVPDHETLRALGFDPNGADPIRDECLRALHFGEPFPSANPAGHPERTTAAATPAMPRDPATPAITLHASDAQPARNATTRLTARTDAPQGAGLLLAIHRQAGAGHPGSSRLVTTCSGMLTCSVEIWEDAARTWTFHATLYQCSAPGVCVAVQESSAVAVTWR